MAFNIVKEKTTAEFIRALSNTYEKPSPSNKVYLMRHLYNMKMVEDASITDHNNEFNVITTQLSSVEIMFEDEVKTLIFCYHPYRRVSL